MLHFLPACVPRISVKLVFFFTIIFGSSAPFRVETLFFQAELVYERETSEAEIVYDSGG